MASLTPLSKGLIGLAVVGAMASAVWHLGLKERFAASTETSPASTSAPAQQEMPAPQLAPPLPAATTPEPSTVPAPVPAPAATTAQAARLSAADNAELGRKLLDSGDFAQARVHLEQAVKDGDGGAACHLGEMTLKGQGGLPANQEKAAALFQLAQSRNIICFASGK
jgi:TPR repeat protein